MFTSGFNHDTTMLVHPYLSEVYRQGISIYELKSGPRNSIKSQSSRFLKTTTLSIFQQSNAFKCLFLNKPLRCSLGPYDTFSKPLINYFCSINEYCNRNSLIQLPFLFFTSRNFLYSLAEPNESRLFVVSKLKSFLIFVCGSVSVYVDQLS